MFNVVGTSYETMSADTQHSLNSFVRGSGSEVSRKILKGLLIFATSRKSTSTYSNHIFYGGYHKIILLWPMNCVVIKSLQGTVFRQPHEVLYVKSMISRCFCVAAGFFPLLFLCTQIHVRLCTRDVQGMSG